MRKPLMIGMVAAVLAVGGAAMVASAGVNPNNGPRPATSTSATAPPQTISQAEAERIAGNAVPGGHVTEADLQTVAGRQAWEVDLSTATGVHDVVIDAVTGQVVSVDHPNAQASEPSAPVTPSPTSPTSPTCRDEPGHDVAEDHCGH